jgi:hypothetical protein
MSEAKINSFDIRDRDNINQRWQEFTFKLDKYFIKHKITDEDEKINELFYYGGLPLHQAYQSNKTPNASGQKDKYDDVIKCITSHINPETSIQTNKCLFRGLYQFEGEPFDDFVQRVKEAARNCGFGTDEDNEAAE